MTTFAAEKARYSNERYMLLRMTPTRFLNQGLADSGSGVYTYVFNAAVTPLRVYRNGVALTQTDSISVGVYDRWMWDEATRTVTISVNYTLADLAPTFVATSADAAYTQVITCDYGVYLTNGIYRTASDDSGSQHWHPRILSTPTFSQDLSELDNAVFSLGNSSVVLANSDAFFQQLLTAADSWKRKAIDIWIGLGAATPQKVFSGTIDHLSLSTSQATVSFFDRYGSLKDTAYCGDAAVDCFYPTSSPPGAVDQRDSGKPVPYIIGISSRKLGRYYASYTGTGTCAGFVGGVALDPAHANRALNWDFTQTPSTSVNRKWLLCRAALFRNSTGLLSVTAITSLGGGLFRFATTNVANNVRAGDTFTVDDGAQRYKGFATTDVDGTGWTAAMVGASASPTMSTNPSDITQINGFGDTTPQVAVINTQTGAVAILFAGYDFTTTSASTSGGNKLLSITLVNNFEARHSGSGCFPAGYLDPSVHQVCYVAFNDLNNSGGPTNPADTQDNIQVVRAVVSTLVTAAGLSMAASEAGYTKAGDLYAQFQIPYCDELNYSPYLKYLQDLLASRGAVIGLDSSGAVTYKVLAAVTASDAAADVTHSELNVLNPGISAAVDYNDVVTGVYAVNPHSPEVGSASLISTRARYLHGAEHAREVRHLLYKFSTIINAFLYSLASRRVAYRFATSIDDIDQQLGAQIKFDHPRILTQPRALTADVTDFGIVSKAFVVGIDRGTGKTTLSAVEGLSDDKVTQGY